jgi:hypothetical protein
MEHIIIVHDVYMSKYFTQSDAVLWLFASAHSTCMRIRIPYWITAWIKNNHEHRIETTKWVLHDTQSIQAIASNFHNRPLPFFAWIWWISVEPQCFVPRLKGYRFQIGQLLLLVTFGSFAIRRDPGCNYCPGPSLGVGYSQGDSNRVAIRALQLQGSLVSHITRGDSEL